MILLMLGNVGRNAGIACRVLLRVLLDHKSSRQDAMTRKGIQYFPIGPNCTLRIVWDSEAPHSQTRTEDHPPLRLPYASALSARMAKVMIP